MSATIRRQLTLFVNGRYAERIERIRRKYNPVQFGLIKAHVTLCREHEIENIAAITERLRSLTSKPLTINFGDVARFSNGKGVLIPASETNTGYHGLRKYILENSNATIAIPAPHITLMHPRNSTCTNEIFSEIQQLAFPRSIIFEKVSLIEQHDGQKWVVTHEFSL